MEKFVQELYKYTVKAAGTRYSKGVVKALAEGLTASGDKAVDLIVGYRPDGSELVLEGVPCPVDVEVKEGRCVELGYAGDGPGAPYVSGITATVEDDVEELQQGLRQAESETPSGEVNGTNRVFHLAHTPWPGASLQVFVGGVLTRQGVDYTLSGSTITFEEGKQPANGEWILAWYRY